MIYILEKLAYVCLFFALISFCGLIYCKIKTAIENKKYPKHQQKMSTDVYFGKIGSIAGKVYVTLLTAGMFSYMILNPAFRNLIGISEQWNWYDVFWLILDIVSSVFTIVSIIFLDTNDKNSNNN